MALTERDHRNGGIPVEEFLRAAAQQQKNPDLIEHGKFLRAAAQQQKNPDLIEHGYHHRKGGIPVEEFLRATAIPQDEKPGHNHWKGGIPVEDFFRIATEQKMPDLIDDAIGRTAAMMEDRKKQRGQMAAISGGRPSGMHVKDFLEASYRDGLLQRDPDVKQALKESSGSVLEATAPRLSEEEILRQLATKAGELEPAAFAQFKRAVIEVFTAAESTKNISVLSTSVPHPFVALIDDEEAALRKALHRHAAESQGGSSEHPDAKTFHQGAYDMGDGADY